MKPRLGWLCLVGYTAVVAQTTLVRHLAIGAVGPDVLLTVVVFLGLFAPAYPALISAWALGLAKDVTGGGPLGAWAVLFVGAAGLLILLRDTFFIRKALTQVLLTGVVAVPINLAYVVGRAATQRGTTAWWVCPLLAFGSAAYTAAIAPGVVWLLGRSRTRLGLADEGRIA